MKIPFDIITLIS